MTIHKVDIPDYLKAGFKRDMLEFLKEAKGLPYEELELFDWYLHEVETLYKLMLGEETEGIKKQIDAGMDEINDSGMIPVQYFIKRSRYSHVIYLASLGEKYLLDACTRLTTALGENILFRLEELNGDKWDKRRRFLERYGRFEISKDLWDNFSTINLIRNSLVHDNGSIDVLFEDEREKVRNKYKGCPGIRVEGYEVEVGLEFIEHAVLSLRKIVDYVDRQLDTIIDRAIKPRSVMP